MRFVAALGVACAALMAVPAMAADCHLGLTVGSMFGRSQHVPEGGAPFTDTFDVNGRGVGAQFGCLAARNLWHYGAAVDLTDTSAKGNMQMLPPNQAFFGETAVEWIGTVRAVGGYQFDPRLSVYLTGGVAATSVKMRICSFTSPSCFIESQKMWGLVGGGGIQYRFLRRLSLTMEYLFFGFEDKPFPNSGVVVQSGRDVAVNPEAQMLRMGLNFHF